MGDSGDSQVGIKFVVKSEGTGDKQAAESINQVKRAATEAAPAHAELKKKTEEAIEADKKHKLSKREVAEATRHLRQEIPGLTVALETLKNPYIALGTVAGLAIGHLRAVHDEIERGATMVQQYESFVIRAASALPTLLVEARKAAKDFAKEWEEMVRKQRDVGKLLNQATGAIKGYQTAADESANQDQSDELDALEARKDLTPEQKAAEQKKIKRRYREAAKSRQRKEMMDEAGAYDLAARAESEKVGDARYQLKGAADEALKAQKDSITAQTLATGTQADFAARAPAALAKIRNLKEAESEADQALSHPPGPRHYGAAVPSREALEKQVKEARKRREDAEEEYKAMVNDNNLAQVNALTAKNGAEEKAGVVSGLRKTIIDSTVRGAEYNETAANLKRGVVRNAATDPDAERARPPIIKGARPGAYGSEEFAGAGEQLNGAAHQIARYSNGLNDGLAKLAQALNGLNTDGELKSKLNKIATDVQALKDQGKNGRL